MLTGGRKYSRTSKIKEGEEKLQIFDDVLRRLCHLNYAHGHLATPENPVLQQ
jgi:hypothetical protein